MKLDPTVMRTMNKQDFRVLQAVETGMKSHSLVPSRLINSIANLRHGGTNKILSSLLRDKLLSHDQSCGYDGYRLTNCGYDILALHNLKSRRVIAGLGDRIGTGKESDVYVAITPESTQLVLKFHRLGRTSFRDVKKKRDYFMVNALSKHRKHGPQHKNLPNSWLFLSRTSALKEYTFMKALHGVGFPTPKPVGHNRHVVVMGLVRGVPLYQLHSNRVSAEQAESIFCQSAILASRLAQHGLVHCDLNEFNLIVDLSGVQAKVAQTENRQDDSQVQSLDDDATEYYVRHSGMPVQTKGALSAHGPLQRHRLIDGTGEAITEAPPEPVQKLENGEPKPIVTLIDFPQMVSTRHPNARDLYERDVLCLKKFFSKKLRCMVEGENSIREEGEKALFRNIMPSWEELVDSTQDPGATSSVEGITGVTCLASESQIRLDEELQAPGYSKEDSARDAELAYFEVHQQNCLDFNKDDDDGGPLSDNDNCQQESDNGEHRDECQLDEVTGAAGVDFNDDYKAGECAPELLDMGDAIPLIGGLNNESVSLAGGISLGGMSQLSHAEAEQIARDRVRKHFEGVKRRSGRYGAFKTRNSNKSYAKGRRIISDYGL